MKKLLCLLVGLLLLISLSGCDVNKSPAENISQYKGALVYIGDEIVHGDRFNYYYDKDTKVMYVANDSYYSGGITPLYNADGTLRLYEEVD